MEMYPTGGGLMEAFPRAFPAYPEGFAHTFPDKFYRLSPLLVSSFPEFKKINHFATVLALARMTKIDGGEFTASDRNSKCDGDT